MANERNPNDPYQANLPDEEIRRQARLNSELQTDPRLAEGPASGGKIAMFAIAIAVVLGVAFYGLNNSSMNPAGTGPSTAQNSPQSSPPAAPTGMRDVTPRNNTEPGMTTGAAPSRPQPPASAPTGTEVNRSAPAPDSTPSAPAPAAK